MPAVRKLGGLRETPAQRRDRFNRIVEVAMIRQGIRTQTKLAERLGMDRLAVNRRFNGITEWSFTELTRLIEVLKIGPEDTADMFGARPSREAAS